MAQMPAAGGGDREHSSCRGGAVGRGGSQSDPAPRRLTGAQAGGHGQPRHTLRGHLLSRCQSRASRGRPAGSPALTPVAASGLAAPPPFHDSSLSSPSGLGGLPQTTPRPPSARAALGTLPTRSGSGSGQGTRTGVVRSGPPWLLLLGLPGPSPPSGQRFWLMPALPGPEQSGSGWVGYIRGTSSSH